MPPTQPATNPSQHASKTPKPQPIIIAGLKTNNIAEISRGLQIASSTNHPELLPWTLSKAISQNNLDAVKHLLEQEHATAATLTPRAVAAHPSTALFQLLLDNGWDINQHDPDAGAGPGSTLLQHVCFSEELIRFLLDHGASISECDRHNDPYENPPLLETVAAIGTASTFTLLRNLGAQLSQRTLHRAVGAVAGIDGESQRVRMAMVEYLVDELKLDINALDSDEKLPNHWGTPLCYVAHNGQGGEEVVRFLLERGADPGIKDCWGIHDAVGLAAQMGNQGVLGLLREWEARATTEPVIYTTSNESS